MSSISQYAVETKIKEIGYNLEDYAIKIIELEEELDEEKDNTYNLNETINQLKESIDSLQGEVDDLRNE